MVKVYFDTQDIPTVPENYNKGQKVEWMVGYVMTGTPSKANNVKGSIASDVLNYQVKSPKASLVNNDISRQFIFGFADADFFYIMSKEEFTNFCKDFTYTDVDSRTRTQKKRVKNDSKKMRLYLETKTVKKVQAITGNGNKWFCYKEMPIN